MIAVVCLLALCGSASAANVLAGLSYYAFGEIGNASSFWYDESADDLTDGNMGERLWFGIFPPETEWSSTHYLRYDLGATCTVDQMRVASDLFASRTVPSSIALRFSDDSGFGTYTEQVVSLAEVADQTVPFAAGTGRYVELRLSSPPGWYFDGKDRWSGTISELALYEAPPSEPIPEPASAVVLLLGLGGVALRRLRR